MTKLPRLTGKQLIKALLRAGFIEARIKGSHHFMVDPKDHTRWATIPVHGGETLTLKNIHTILKSTKLIPEEIRKFL